MSVRRLAVGIVLLAAVLTATGAPSNTSPSADEQLLQSVQVGTDGPALLAYFRQRTVGDADRHRIEALIRQLGDPAYAVRERASASLVRNGLPAVGLLRQAVNDPDVEIARRAERCRQQIEKVPSTALTAAAARLIAHRKPSGAVGVLLDYLPLADDETVADEVREALAAVAQADGRPDPRLEQALEDPLPVKRGAAAEALARTGRPAAVDASRKALADGHADVRLRAALALVTRAKDRRSVPALIRLLAELPQGDGWRVEEVLIRLAGEEAPKVPLGDDEGSRTRCRAAWVAWWDRAGAAVDLAVLDSGEALLGHTLVVLRNRTSGKVIELNTAREVVWTIDKLEQPTDAVVVGKDRVLIAEQPTQAAQPGRGVIHRVSEHDLTGRVLWSKPVAFPIGVQRLPNGHTFVTARDQLVEWDAERKQVFSYSRNQHDVIAARKLRNGDYVYLTNKGTCVYLDHRGKELRSFPNLVGQTYYPSGDVAVLPDGRILVTQPNGVAEFDRQGRQVWRAAYTAPNSVQRLPNGNTLVASLQAQRVAELSRTGQTVWEYRPADGATPWRARRR